MAYTPTTWANGDTITAAGLNKMEQGIAGGVMLMYVDMGTGICDKTWQQVHDALAAGTPVYYAESYTDSGMAYATMSLVMSAIYDSSSLTHVYLVYVLGMSSDGHTQVMDLHSTAANDYLSFV